MQPPDSVLDRIKSPADLKGLSDAELAQLAAEMRAELIGVVGRRSAHFASNLGVVELCLALHLTFDFTQDRLIWDTGHQIYPHKLITGRADAAAHDPHQGGPDGLPQPGREPLRPVHDRPRRLRAVHGPGPEGRRRPGRPARPPLASPSSATAPSPPASSSRRSTTPAASRRSCWSSSTTTRCRSARASAAWPTTSTAPGCPAPTTTGTSGSSGSCPTSPWSASTAERWLQQFKDAIKASLHHGMLFEELGFVYLGPIDGHDLKTLRSYLERVKAMDGPGPAPRPDQQGARLRAGREGPGQVPRPRAVPAGRRRHRPAQDLVEPHLHRRRQRQPSSTRARATRRSP